jgi:hypothetical protein
MVQPIFMPLSAGFLYNVLSILEVACMPQFRIRFIRVPRWQIMLGAGLAFAMMIALFVLAFGIFLLLLPVLAIAGAIFYLFGARRPPVGRDGATNDRIIDGEYRVVEQDRLDHPHDRSH